MLSRRLALRSLLAGTGLALASPAAAAPKPTRDPAAALRPDAAEDQSEAFGRALADAAARGRPLVLPPGSFRIRNVALPPRIHLVGAPGATRLVSAGGAALLHARDAQSIRIEGVTFDGEGGVRSTPDEALLQIETADDAVIAECVFVNAAGHGVRLTGCAGRVERCRLADIADVGLYLSGSRSMSVDANVVTGCGNAGILVHRYEKGEDGTIVRGNRVSAIRADAGGTGQNGNGINTVKANGVTIADNRVDGCAFSAIRCFSSESVQITGNSCTRSGETALYVEFAFNGAIVSANLVDGANGGISLPNFPDYGGRLAAVTGNIVRNIRGGPAYPNGDTQPGQGIAVEADAALTGNVVENALIGLRLGNGPYLRDVAATGNVIRGCPLGVSVTVVPGAGAALIVGNIISGATSGAVVGVHWDKPVTGDLTGAADPQAANVTLSGNRIV